MAEANIVLSAEDRTARVIAGLKANLGTVSGEVATLARGFGLLGPAIVGGLSGAAFAGFLRGTAQGLNALVELKEATGSTVENISALEDIAARTGTSFDSVGAALIKFNKALNEARDENSDAALVFKSLGLSVQELAKLDPSVGLLKTAKALESFKDDGGKARAELLLLGKSTRELAPFLKDLAQAGELNATVTTEQAEQAKKFSDRLSALAKSATDTGREIFGSLLPALEAIQDAFGTTGARASLLADVVRVPFETAAVVGANVAFVFKVLGSEIGAILARIAALGSASPERFAAINDAVKEDTALARKELDAFERRVLQLDKVETDAAKRREQRGFDPNKLRPTLPDVKKPDKPEAEKISDARRELAQFVEQQEKQLQGLQHISEQQEALNLLQRLGTLGEVPQVRELVLALAEKQQKLKEEVVLLKELEAAEKALEEIHKKDADAESQRLQQLLEFSGIAEERRKKALTETLEKNAGLFTTEQLEKAAKGIGGVRDELEKVNNTAEQMGEAFGSAFEGAIIGGKGLKDTLKGLEQDILRITTRKLITEPIAGGATNFFRGLGGSGGNTSDAGPVQPGGLEEFFKKLFGSFAVGTDFVTRDQLAFIHRGEKIIPAAENRRGGNAPQITINMNGSGGQVDRATIAQLQAAVGLATSRAMRRNL